MWYTELVDFRPSHPGFRRKETNIFNCTRGRRVGVVGLGIRSGFPPCDSPRQVVVTKYGHLRLGFPPPYDSPRQVVVSYRGSTTSGSLLCPGFLQFSLVKTSVRRCIKNLNFLQFLHCYCPGPGSASQNMAATCEDQPVVPNNTPMLEGKDNVLSSIDLKPSVLFDELSRRDAQKEEIDRSEEFSRRLKSHLLRRGDRKGKKCIE